MYRKVVALIVSLAAVIVMLIAPVGPLSATRAQAAGCPAPVYNTTTIGGGTVKSELDCGLSGNYKRYTLTYYDFTNYNFASVGVHIRVWICGNWQGSYGTFFNGGTVDSYTTGWFTYNSCGAQADNANFSYSNNWIVLNANGNPAGPAAYVHF